MRIRHSLLLSALYTYGVLCATKPQAQVYFYPSIQDHHQPPTLNDYEANSVISQHLGLDAFDSAEDHKESWWNEMNLWLPGRKTVGQGSQDSVLIIIESDHPNDFVPSTLRPAFIIDNPPPPSMFTDLIHAYTERARHLADSVFSSLAPFTEKVTASAKSFLDTFDLGNSASARTFVTELQKLVGFVDEQDEKMAIHAPISSSQHQSFSAFEVKGLAALQSEQGRQSDQYQTAAKSIQAVLINDAIRNARTALIVVPSTSVSTSSYAKRQLRAQQPVSAASVPGVVFSVSTCFASNSTCAESTNGCSGHGSCVPTSRAGKTCYTCACIVTRNDAGRKQWWGGAACEKLDLSTSFTLLAGTTVFLIVLVAFSAALLYSIGAETLPNTLTAGAVPHSKRE